MQTRLNELSRMFQTKGFVPVEIPDLIKDVSDILNQQWYCSLTDINQGLEDLGWGIEIIDKMTYESMLTTLSFQ